MLYLIITHHSIQVLLSLSLNYYIFIYPRSMIYFCIRSIIHLLLLFEFSRYNVTKTSWIVVILMSNRWWMNLKKKRKSKKEEFYAFEDQRRLYFAPMDDNSLRVNGPRESGGELFAVQRGGNARNCVFRSRSIWEGKGEMPARYSWGYLNGACRFEEGK